MKTCDFNHGVWARRRIILGNQITNHPLWKYHDLHKHNTGSQPLRYAGYSLNRSCHHNPRVFFNRPFFFTFRCIALDSRFLLLRHKSRNSVFLSIVILFLLWFIYGYQSIASTDQIACHSTTFYRQWPLASTLRPHRFLPVDEWTVMRWRPAIIPFPKQVQWIKLCRHPRWREYFKRIKMLTTARTKRIARPRRQIPLSLHWKKTGFSITGRRISGNRNPEKWYEKYVM